MQRLNIPRPYWIRIIIHDLHHISRSHKRGRRLYSGTIEYNRERVAMAPLHRLSV
jgi:hypothetical protein